MIARRNTSGAIGFCKSVQLRSLASRKASDDVSPVMIKIGKSHYRIRARLAGTARSLRPRIQDSIR